MNPATQRRIRRAARIVVLDPDERVLLFRCTFDGLDPFWVLPGGELEPHEDFAEAARRELLEETGIQADPVPMDHQKQADYEYLGEPVRSLEHYFHLRAETVRIDTTGHTEIEQAFMKDHRWFTGSELHDWPETIYPEDLPRLIARRLP